MKPLCKSALVTGVAAAFAGSFYTPCALANPVLTSDLTAGPASTLFRNIEASDNKLQFVTSNRWLRKRYMLGAQDGLPHEIQLQADDYGYGSTKIGDQFVFVQGLHYSDWEVWVQNSDLTLELLYKPELYDDNGSNNNVDDIPVLSSPIYVENNKAIIEIARYDYSDIQNIVKKFDLISIDPVTKEVEVLRVNFDRPTGSLGRFSWEFNGKTYRTADDQGYGEELWKSTGYTNFLKSQLVADINPGDSGSFISDPAEMNGVLYFQANGNGGRELWKMDAAENVERVADINPSGPAFTFNQNLREQYHIFEDELYFLADHADYGLELWKTDGTEAGTQLMADSIDGEDGVFIFKTWEEYPDQDGYSQAIEQFDTFRVGINVGSGFFYRLQHEDREGPVSVWYSDGTVDGTRKVFTEPERPNDSQFYNRVYNVRDKFAIGSSFFVSYRSDTEGEELWRLTDGKNVEALEILKDVDQISVLEHGINDSDGTALLRVLDGNRIELWKTDGTVDGTSFIKTVAINNWVHSDPMISVGNIDNKILFVAYNNDTGRELWITDGTTAGTHMVTDIADGPESSIIDESGDSTTEHTGVLNGFFYFHASDGIHGLQMWVTDGTASGTTMWDPIYNTNQDAYSSGLGVARPDDFVMFNGSYYFAARGGDYGIELWKYTPESTTPPPETGTGSLGDFVWQDTNANGIQDAGELGLEGITVELQSCSGDFVASTTTDSMGAYRFENVAEDHFQLQFMLPSGYEFSPEKATPEFKLDSNANETTGVSPCYDMTQGYQRLAVDAGMVPTTAPSGDGLLGDFVWQDTNGDGIQDSNEPGLAGVTVNLESCSGSIIDSMVTDSNGGFVFENIGAGDYRLEFELLDGFSFSPEKSTDLFKQDSNANETTGLTACYNMDAGWKRRAIDAGMVPDDIASADTLTIVKAIYFSAENKLWVRASSDAEPQGSAYLSASVEANGVTTDLGQVDWKADKGFYQTNFRDLSQVSSTITVMSDLGGEVTANVEVR